ncbi:hypothetical protein HN51_053845 [Arachis hypogaea]
MLSLPSSSSPDLPSSSSLSVWTCCWIVFSSLHRLSVTVAWRFPLLVGPPPICSLLPLVSILGKVRQRSRFVFQQQHHQAVDNVQLMKDRDSGEGKGYAFVAFKTKEVAQNAIEEIHNKKYKVKALYVKNILENTTTKQFKELFSRHGEVTKVVMPPSKAGGKRDFGFIHYAERSSALKAVKDSEKYEIDGQLLEVVLVKPQAEKKPNMGYDYNPGLAHLEFGGAFAGNLHGSVIGVAGAGYGVAPSWMVLMALPNGKIGYVLEQGDGVAFYSITT